MTTSIDTLRKRAHRRTSTTWLLRVGAVVVGALLLLVGLWGGLRLSRSGVLPGVRVEGIPVGGMSSEQLHRTVDELAQRYEGETVTAMLLEETVTGTNAAAGYDLDVERTVERVWERGRQSNPVLSLLEHLRAFREPTDVAVVESVDATLMERWTADTAAALEFEPVEGDVTLEGTEVARIDPRQGAAVDRETLRDGVHDAVLARGDDTVEVPFERLDTVTTTADIDEAYERAQRVVSAPIVLTRNDGTITLEPEQLGELVRIERSLSDEGASFDFLLPAEELAGLVPDDAVAAFETDAVSADISLQDGEIVISQSRNGFVFDPQAAADQVLEIATTEAGNGDPREAVLAGDVVEPDRTTEEAEELQIVEEVSSFTTQHQCCQQRVTNIQRFADIVDGAVIEPGETFSLNEHVGERTRDKGFVGGGAIFRGEFVEQVGGGVSQFATTFFNAAYFGGYDIIDYKAHSYYISRYPVGRESTINWPNVDVKIENNSPYGILVETSYTSTSITVTFWGKQWVEVDSVTGERHNFKQPTVEYRENNDLPAGESRVIQETGGPGFDIVVTRILTYPDGETEREEFFTRYLPENRIVERNT